jgi:hypothetical protein
MSYISMKLGQGGKFAQKNVNLDNCDVGGIK